MEYRSDCGHKCYLVRMHTPVHTSSAESCYCSISPLMAQLLPQLATAQWGAAHHGIIWRSAHRGWRYAVTPSIIQCSDSLGYQVIMNFNKFRFRYLLYFRFKEWGKCFQQCTNKWKQQIWSYICCLLIWIWCTLEHNSIIFTIFALHNTSQWGCLDTDKWAWYS